MIAMALIIVLPSVFRRRTLSGMMDLAEAAIESSGEDYNVYVPIRNCLGRDEKGKNQTEIGRGFCLALERHLKQVPEDARARILLAASALN